MKILHTYRSRFTLIELLVVVALTSLLLALGMPAFSRMMRGNKVEECARNIKLGLEQAQLRAASERRYVAVIFPSGNVDASLQPYRLGGFRCAYVTKETSDESTVYKFGQWLDSEWRNAPSGAMLVKAGTGADTASLTDGYVTGCTETITAALPEPVSALLEVNELKDDANAALSAGGRNAVIFSPYGGTVQENKTYLLVSETEVNGTDIVYPSAGGSGVKRTANYLVLKVNNLTGRVEYYGDEE